MFNMFSLIGGAILLPFAPEVAGLFFIPSLKGISHRPDEDSRREDIKLAGEILYKWAVAELDRVF